MIDDGWMILTGFNPVSLMGLRKLVPVLRKTTPYKQPDVYAHASAGLAGVVEF
ncbi:Uncharacterised protein [Raoultella planticola]|uniref:Uncharacterized protein n=1 Tax=Raoultella planticola TaxID=575 RepID=A0A485B559_RAOPL|nr:Uncharacterised protein [Raoultella planticola]